VSWTTDQVLRRLVPGEERVDWLHASGEVALVDVAVPTSLAGRKVAELDEPGAWSATVVTRMGAAQLVTPGLVAQEGDRLHLTARLDVLDRLRERFGGTAQPHTAQPHRRN
jgi:trk system potassium uptake protein TrkA